jgi:hypothetical protein
MGTTETACTRQSLQCPDLTPENKPITQTLVVYDYSARKVKSVGSMYTSDRYVLHILSYFQEFRREQQREKQTGTMLEPCKGLGRNNILNVNKIEL